MQATPETHVWATSLLDDCQKMVQSQMRPLLQKMFENSNLAFLEFAEKAQSAASQIQFMEALTVIQKNRLQVEDIFHREIAASFNRFGRTARQQAPATEDADTPLTLLSKEETDIEVAIQNMTASATMGAAQELGALRQRMAVLNNGQAVESDEIPASPSCLAEAFHEAANSLVLEHQTKLVVYMLFDKFVLGKLGQLYHDYNERLIKAGILPNLKYKIRKNPVTGTSEAVEDTSTSPSQGADRRPATHAPGQRGDDPQSLGDELFGNIMQLLARRNNQSGPDSTGRRSAAGTDGSGPGQADDGGGPAVSNPLPQTEIVTAIDRVQHAAPVEGIRAEQVVAIQPGTEEHRTIVETISKRLSAEREQLFTGIDRRRMPAADTQVIDLVGMMFDYLLKDEDLPNVAKAELCRLHTPYLKVAIIDKSFFTDKSHPAHELLDTLASTASRWVFEDDLERGIFPSIRVIVQRVIDEFVNNVELFSELLGVFNRSLNELVSKASAIEERTRQAAAGKEKLGYSRKQAARAIRECVAGRNVPTAIRKMLEDVWLDKLMFIYLREPEADRSPGWRLGLRTIEDIIWSVEPRFTDETQAELRVKLPTLRHRIEQAFSDLEAYGTCDSKTLLKQIRELQDEALSQPVDEQAPVAGAADTKSRDHGDTAGGDGGETTDHEIEEQELTPEVRAALESLKDIPFGTWFFIQASEDSHPVRVKLSWFSKMSGNYMFVDSMGVKSTVWKQNELAELLAGGKARIIDEAKTPFVKRALVAIRRILTGD